MKKTCREIRKNLVASGPAALRGDDKAQDHVVDCAECFAFIEALSELEKTFEDMPEHDAPDELVERLLASPELAVPATAVEPPPLPRRQREADALRGVAGRLEVLRQAARWLVARPRRLVFAAGPVMAVLLIGLLAVNTMDKAEAPDPDMYTVKQVQFEPPTEVDEQLLAEKQEEAKKGSIGDDKRQAKEERQDVADEFSDGDAERLSALGYVDAGDGAVGVDVLAVPEPEIVVTAQSPVIDTSNMVYSSPAPPEPAAIPAPKTRRVPIPDPTPDDPEPIRDERGKARQYNRQAEQDRGALEQKVGGLRRQAGELDRLGSTDEANMLRDQVAQLESALRASSGKDDARKPGRARAGERSRELEEAETLGLANEGRPADGTVSRSEITTASGGAVRGDEGGLSVTTDGTQARQFLAQQAQVDGVGFKDPRGYWANTYVPGDWELRQLHARLADRDRAALQAFRQQALKLHDGSHQAAQPYDPPDDSALAVYLHADRRGLVARERMLVEVGIKATPRRSGRRGAMNVGVVLDLRGEVPVEVASSMRALVEAFSRSCDLGDRFSLIVAGRPGALVVPAGDFRHGPLTVAMGELFGDSQPGGETLDLASALRTAFDTVSAADDPTTPLGSSVVVLVTGQGIGAASPNLVSIAHSRAVEGVPMSVVGIGTGVGLDEIDRLVLAGQGNRRLLQTAADAKDVVDRELSSVARVVARAVRLRIRLAPGVQLVNVIGSESLDEARAQEVRDAEISIDRRLSRNLGIQADRGLDEEGIQIVIPTFYADDSHVVLLDVVSPGPGPVADVTVRYKDLVWLRNGVGRAHLSLGRSEAPPGPLELNVLKNLLARRLGVRLESAGQALAHGGRDQALGLLTEFRTLLFELTVEVAGFESDPDIRADIAMLDEYIALLEAGADQVVEQQQYLVDSLNYAGRLKVLPTPAGDGE